MQCMVWNAWSCENADMQTLCMKSFSRVILQEKDFSYYITILFTLFFLPFYCIYPLFIMWTNMVILNRIQILHSTFCISLYISSITIYHIFD